MKSHNAEPTKGEPDFQEQIRLRAYQLYESRGRVDGHDLEDWLAAEDEVTNPKTQAIAA
jgi:hypothetical protein